MVISTQCMVIQANTCLTAVNSVCSIAQLIGVNINLDNTPYAVANLAALPNATCNTGRFVYVSDIGVYRFSDGTSWVRDFTTDSLLENVLSWGLGSSGQLGNGTASSLQLTPVEPSGGYDLSWCAASAGGNHTSAIKTNGSVWVWGNNSSGQLGTGTTTNRSSPGTTVGGGLTWCQVSAGTYQTAALKTNGTLWTWGRNSYGQLGNGTVVNSCSPVTVCGGGDTWCAVSAGEQPMAAVKTDGTLWTWGRNNLGQLGNETVVNRSSPGQVAGTVFTWCAVSAGQQHVAAVKIDGTLWAWGYNSSGQLGNSTVVNLSSPGQVAGGGYTWCAVSAGADMTTAIQTNGTAWTWGLNNLGQLGMGTTVNRSSPGPVTGTNSLWCGISSGLRHNAAIKTDGSVWTWGANYFGELGNVPQTNRSSPGPVSGNNYTWCMIDAGGRHTVGVVAPP